MIQINIKEQFKNDYITRAAGEKLRLSILEAQHKNECIEVDFTGIVIGSTSFFDEAFSKLSEEGWDAKTIEKIIIFKGINKLDLKVLKQVCEYRGLKITLNSQ